MFRNYILVAIRSILRHKIFSVINILGLSIGAAAFLLLMMYVTEQYSVDKFHQKRDLIFRVEFNNYVINPPQNAALLLDNFPAIEKLTRINFYNKSQTFSFENNTFQFNNMIWADSCFFDIFSFDIVSGNRDNILMSPFEVVITESMAFRVFGQENPVGQVLLLRNNQPFTVTGVMKDLPPNSTIQADAVGSFLSVPWIMGFNELEDLSSYSNFHIYILINSEADARQLEDEIYRQRFLNSGLSDEDEFNLSVRLRPLTETYFVQGVEFDHAIKKGNRAFVLIFLSAALFILSIAGINFVNLSTAAASLRAREIGVRKVAGASKTSLVSQFLVETMVMCVISGFISLVLVELALPRFNNLVASDLNIAYSVRFVLLILAGVVSLGIIAGLYPSFYLTRFSPAAVLKGSADTGPAGSRFRKTLIVLQYVISIVLIISTLVVYEQINYMKSKDLGFDRENIVILNLSVQEMTMRRELLRERILAHPDVSHVSFSNSIPGRVAMKQGFYYLDDVQSFYSLPVGDGYLELMGIKLSEGRDFIAGSQYERGKGYIINQTAARLIYGNEPAVGKRFRLWEREEFGEVIGVMEDFNFHSLHSAVEPLVIYYRPDWCSVVNVRYNNGRSSEAVGHIEQIWAELFPGKTYSYYFLEESFDYLYRTEDRFRRMFGNASLLAVFIASIGLYGLTSFTVLRRIKEIGIRKVMGAGELRIVGMLVVDFTRWVAIANTNPSDTLRDE